MSTDHTSESSWEAAFDPAGQKPFVTPTFDDAVESEADPIPEQAAESGRSEEPDLELDHDLEHDSDVAHASESPAESLRESLQSGAVDAIEFRVNRPGTPVRRLRLTGNRYTFGSAEGCSIRLNDRDLRPMHAVLIREASRTLVRAYSVPIDVNGTRITEAELHPGDVLSLGAYRFELLDDEEASAHRSQSASEEARPWRSIFESSPTRPFGSSSYGGQRLGLGSGLSSSEDVIWKDRLRREIEQWRERQVDCDRRENRCDEREAKLRDRETELWSRAESLYRRESRLQSQEASTFQLYDEFTKHQEELIQIREAAHKRQESFHQREIAFRNQEIEYRQRLDEATRQLHLSQEQAETATHAVQRMREQFDSLHQQIEELSDQHTTIELREQQQRQEHEKLLAELEASRDKAVEGQAESEARRSQAEARLEQLEAHLESLQDERGSDLTAQQKRLAESERAAKELRQQVQELQQSLSQATEESARLRVDYEDAFASVVQLESIIADTSQSSDKDRDTWEAEADELRASVERLSLELSNANRELGELRDANAQLNARLDDMQRQRDEAQADADARPTPEAFHSLQEELTVTNEQLTLVRSDYEESLQQLSETQRERELDQEKASQALADALAFAEASLAAEPAPSDFQSPDQCDEVVDQRDEVVDQLADDTHEYLIEQEEADDASWDDASPWNLESPDPQDRDDDSGSLANLLIRDLEEESQAQDRVTEDESLDASSDLEVDNDLQTDIGWDQEHDEEAYPTRWKNDPAGFRVEEIEQTDHDDRDAYEQAEHLDADEFFDEMPLDEMQDAASTEEVASAISDVSSPLPEIAADDSEDSIEAYMNRLLRRVHGQPLDEAAKAAPASNPKSAPTAKKEAVVTPPKEVVEKIDPDAPFVARSRAPEMRTSLSAMRELANTSARVAISRSARVQTRDTQIKGAFSFACATGAVACGIACYFFIPGIMRYLAVAMTVVVASIYVREGWLLLREASRQLKAAELGVTEQEANDANRETDAETVETA